MFEWQCIVMVLISNLCLPLQFDSVFWDDVDFFGVSQPGGEVGRGRCFMFWNLSRVDGGVPMLAALLAGHAARAAEDTDDEHMQEAMLQASVGVFWVTCHVTVSQLVCVH